MKEAQVEQSKTAEEERASDPGAHPGTEPSERRRPMAAALLTAMLIILSSPGVSRWQPLALL
ncbi:MAG: hypothetical protein JRI68_16635, partial [Deltaproteobacteria bacterium]|nr:hypothetical protein [Deltaproteobacteria bacterium]